MPYQPLTKVQITSALVRLGELAQAEGLTIELTLYGGAIFTLVYDARDATKDVDAIAKPSEPAAKLARVVAREQGLPEDWLNDQVKQFVAEKEAKRQLVGDEFGPGLNVLVPTAKYLLAMKLRASRRPLPGYAGDFQDIRFLVEKMNLSRVEEAEEIFDQFFPADPLPVAGREVVIQKLKELKK